MSFEQQQAFHILKVKEEIRQEIKLIHEQPWYKPELPFEHVFLTGGAIASLIQGEVPNDWDFYFENQHAMQMFNDFLIKDKIDYVGDVNPAYDHALIKGKAVTPRAITMSSKHSFITMMTGSPDEIRSTFDYKHCMPYYHVGDDKLYISEEQYLAAFKKHLVVNNKARLKPYRQDKFMNRGYSIDKQDII